MFLDKIKSLRLRYILLIGIIIRFIFLPFFAHPFDMHAWYFYIEDILNQGISFQTLDINPIWKLILIPIAYLYDWLSNLFNISVILVSTLPVNFDPSYGITVVTDPIFNTLVKMPLLIADIISAILIYRISFFYTKDYSISKGLAGLFFLSPLVIWISTAWGQYDSLAVLFTLLSFYLLLVSKRIVFSSLALYLAVFIKIYPIIFIIPIIVSILRFDNDRNWKVIKFTIILIPLILYLIFFQMTKIHSFLNELLFPSTFFFTSGFGLTYWSISLIMSIDILLSTLLSNIVLIVLVSLSFYYIIRRANTQFDVVILGSFLFTSSLFLSLTIVSEQRSLILLALLSLVMINRPLFRSRFIILSFIGFLYVQKNFPFYLLPIASRFPDSFSFFFSFTSSYINRTSDFIGPIFISGVALAILGISFSAILLTLVWNIFNNR